MPNSSRRQDYEYRRGGTRNLFLFVEPKAGKRTLLVTQRRGKTEFAQAMRYLVDTLYPQAEVIDVVLDNLNTHTYLALVETFGKREADRLAARLCFHYTPPHGSWLNMAEIELFNWQDHIGFTGTYRPHAVKASREELVEIGLRYLNAPFQAGGRSIFGLDEAQGFALIFAIAGYSWISGKIPGKSVTPEEALPGDLFIFRDLEKQETHFGLFLGAENILWMDNKMKVSDLDEWEDFLRNNTGEQVVFDTRMMVG